MKQVEITAVGGPEVLHLVERPVPAPGPGEALVRHTAIGVNFVDTYFRRGLYPLPLPAVLGVEAAGVVEAVADGVTDVRVGDRVVYAGSPNGAYAEARVMPADRLLPIPDAISDRVAAASLLRGLTVHMLLHRVFHATAGDTILIHAAAGGVGLLAVQWAKRMGLMTIGTVGSAAKADHARSRGLDHAILYRETDFVSAVRDLTDGKGVAFAIDGIGGETLAKTRASLRPFGIVASIGQAEGPIPPIDVLTMRAITLSRPSVLAYVTEPVAYRTGTAALFDRLTDGLAVDIGAEYPLAEAAAAHAALEAGKTTGSVVLIP